MDFKAYGKTKHSNDAGFIRRVLQERPELLTATYVATEKLDGTNFTLMFEPDGTVRQGSRNQEVTLDMTHFDYHNAVLEQYKEEIDSISQYAQNQEVTVRVYGELFGRGVLPRIDYGDTKRFLPFQLEIAGHQIPVEQARDFMLGVVGHVWWSPVIAIFKGIVSALEFDVDSFEDRKIEGVVIEPYYTVFESDKLGKFKLKMKTKEFCDTMSVKQKKVKEKEELTGRALELLTIYEGYFNKNRLLDLIAKEGELTEMSQMGKYIKLMCQDCKEDLLEHHKEVFCALRDSEKKVILGSGGRSASPIVREHVTGLSI
jgi:Rnl2 family RNA ligase